MKLDKSELMISLGEQETQVALAFLGKTETFKILAGQISEKVLIRGLHRVNASNHMPHASNEEIDELLKREVPDLFTYKLPYDQRAPLLGAFVLGAEQQEPSRTDVLEGLTAEEVVSVAQTARDSLLALK